MGGVADPAGSAIRVQDPVVVFHGGSIPREWSLVNGIRRIATTPNVGAQFWSVWVPSDLPEEAAVVSTLEQVDAVYRLVTSYPRVFGFAATAGELGPSLGVGRIASLTGI